MISYLRELGVTAVELQPIQAFIADRFLSERSLTNYWGYNTIGFFAPDSRYAGSGVIGQQVTEFKSMVRELHRAGIEVILDVVYNHTAEGNECGPTLCFRGIDNAAYYRLCPDDKSKYFDYTGTGNTLNANLPPVLKLIMDSLRYWITEMHVDGFRFDLAATLARELHEVNQLSAFFDIIYQDPVISRVKLIAEPRDVGEGGYQVGNFPAGWAEWNGKFRDCTRKYWGGAEIPFTELANRITGSPDLYQSSNRTPAASINFVTAHDGFTLHDLVSYEIKHNEQNGDNNTDGESQNHSVNWGVEGDTDDATVNEHRLRHKRNLLATLFLSQGVPMLLAGDELGNTQSGNNNTYCQDNELTWIQWGKGDKDLLAFTQALIALRKQHPTFCRKGWFQGIRIAGSETKDIAWFQPDGQRMREEEWNGAACACFGVYLDGRSVWHTDAAGKRIPDDSFLLLFNGNMEEKAFILPRAKYGLTWKRVFHTGSFDQRPEESAYGPGDVCNIDMHSMVLLSHGNPPKGT